jgi:hypothetical protein
LTQTGTSFLAQRQDYRTMPKKEGPSGRAHGRDAVSARKSSDSEQLPAMTDIKNRTPSDQEIERLIVRVMPNP